MSDMFLPSPECVESLIPRLLGAGVKTQSVAVGPDLTKPYIVASYVDEANVVSRVLICDLTLANSMGAAFSMIPPAVANDASKAGNMPENIQINLHEVLNILVNLFTEHWSERLALSEFKTCSAIDPKPSVSKSVQYAVTIPRYIGGTMLAGSV